MPRIMKLSALRNCTKVLEEAKPGDPVYLTKNGEGSFIVWQRLFAELEESISIAERFGWIDEEEADDYIRHLFEFSHHRDGGSIL